MNSAARNLLLEGKTAIVTGSNRGIGKAILTLFAQHGAAVFACARRETPEFNELLEQLRCSTGVPLTPLYFDLRDASGLKDALRTITSSRQRVDVLVNNAGIASGALFQMTPVESLRELFEVNFFSPMQFTQGVARYMARFKAGSIINVASTAALLADRGTTGYGASKAALIFATRTLATELGPSNIRVNALAPSVTQTDMYEQMDPKARDSLIASTALGRAAEPDEVAKAALFLASDLSTYVTGQVLRVDGGLH